jgi:TniQ
MPSPTAPTGAESVVLRRLPQHTRPLHNELLDSFLDRLSERNGLHAKTLANIVKSSDQPPLTVVATLTGLPAQSLRAALPELRNPAALMVARPSRHTALGFDGTNTACTECVARRTRGDQGAHVWSHNYDTVCRRHRRWLSSPIMHGRRQFTLDTTPEVLAASRRHLWLIRRRGHDDVDEAFTKAIALIQKWHGHRQLPNVADRLFRLANANRPTSLSTITSQTHAAVYPETVRLTTLLVTPGWLSAATSGRHEWSLATDQIANQITAGYHPAGITLDVFERLQLRVDHRGPAAVASAHSDQ